MNDITIISASRGHEAYLNLNLRLTDFEGIKWSWIVAQQKRLPWMEKTELDPAFQVVHSEVGPPIKSDDRSDPLYWSECHAAGLTEALKHVGLSKILLVLDADFYIVPPLQDVMAIMRSRSLALFGCPYSWSKTPLIRDFPVAFCLFINLAQVYACDIDFKVGYQELEPDGNYPDVGHAFYRRMKAAEYRYDFAIPSSADGDFKRTTQTVKSRYGIAYDRCMTEKGTKVDEYFLGDNLFGLHCRSKIHQSFAQNPEIFQDRLSRHLKGALRVVKAARDAGAAAPSME